MTKFILWSRDHPVLVIILITLATLFFGYHARSIQIDASAEGMMIEHDPDRAFYDGMIQLFGSDNISVVYIRDRDLFSYDKLKAVEDVFYKLEKIHGVERVDGLFNTTNFKNVDGTLETSPLLDSIPKDSQALARVREDALRSPLLNKTLISPDGQGIAITVTAEHNTKDRKFNIRIADEIDRVIAPLQDKVDAVFQVGAPMTRRHLSSSMIGDQKRLVPLSIAVLLVMLVLGIRTANGGIIPLITGGLSILWTVGFMAWTGIPLNVLTVIVPSLLIVVGSTEDMHMVAEYLEGLKHTGDRMKAIDFFGRRLGVTVLLTALTTYLGFLSIVLNDITLLKQFGWASSFGFLVNPLVTFSVIPVYLRYFGEKKLPKQLRNAGGQEAGDIYQRWADRLAGFVVCHKRRILWISFMITGLIASGVFFVKLDNDLLGYFKPDSEIRVRSAQLQRELSGTQNFFLVLDGKEKGAFRDPLKLKKISEIQKFIEDSGLFDSSISLATHVAFINREMSGGKKEDFQIPAAAALVPQYLLFFTRQDLERYVTSDYRRANVIVRHHLSSSYELEKALRKLEDFIKIRLGPDVDYKITGEGILINKAADTMAAGQISSLAVLLFVLFIIMAVLFVRIKAGFLSMASNIVPILMLFGIMGYFRIPLGVGTAMIADIAIGIAIDDTIHLMVRYNDYMKKLNDQTEALRLTLREEMKPVVTVTMGLTLGFAVMAFSNFVPLIYFGLLSAMVMALGLFAEFFITTSLLANTKLITLWDMLGLRLTREVIKGSPLFRNMSQWQIKKIVLMAHTQAEPRDSAIIRQGDKGRTMYMLLEGNARVEHRNPSGERVVLQDLGPGDVFGEIALVNEVERTADVVAMTDAKVLSIDWDSLERINRIFPRISSKFFLNISRILGRRLALANDQIKLSRA